jgi:hypothetical protein
MVVFTQNTMISNQEGTSDPFRHMTTKRRMTYLIEVTLNLSSNSSKSGSVQKAYCTYLRSVKKEAGDRQTSARAWESAQK